MNGWISAIVSVVGLGATLGMLIWHDGRRDATLTAAVEKITDMAAEEIGRARRDGKIDQILDYLTRGHKDHEDRLRAGGL